MPSTRRSYEKVPGFMSRILEATARYSGVRRLLEICGTRQNNGPIRHLFCPLRFHRRGIPPNGIAFDDARFLPAGWPGNDVEEWDANGDSFKEIVIGAPPQVLAAVSTSSRLT